jgi:hypothetical protein
MRRERMAKPWTFVRTMKAKYFVAARPCSLRHPTMAHQRRLEVMGDDNRTRSEGNDAQCRSLHELVRRLNLAAVRSAGDYCFDSKGRVIMSCPACSAIFVCADHKVEKVDPLTLSPSVVGPEKAIDPARWQVLAKPCLHHFFVVNGEAVNVS